MDLRIHSKLLTQLPGDEVLDNCAVAALLCRENAECIQHATQCIASSGWTPPCPRSVRQQGGGGPTPSPVQAAGGFISAAREGRRCGVQEPHRLSQPSALHHNSARVSSQRFRMANVDSARVQWDVVVPSTVPLLCVLSHLARNCAETCLVGRGGATPPPPAGSRPRPQAPLLPPLDPAFPYGYLHRARAYRCVAQLEAAVKDLTAALELKGPLAAGRASF